MFTAETNKPTYARAINIHPYMSAKVGCPKVANWSRGMRHPAIVISIQMSLDTSWYSNRENVGLSTLPVLLLQTKPLSIYLMHLWPIYAKFLLHMIRLLFHFGPVGYRYHVVRKRIYPLHCTKRTPFRKQPILDNAALCTEPDLSCKLTIIISSTIGERASVICLNEVSVSMGSCLWEFKVVNASTFSPGASSLAPYAFPCYTKVAII